MLNKKHTEKVKKILLGLLLAIPMASTSAIELFVEEPVNEGTYTGISMMPRGWAVPSNPSDPEIAFVAAAIDGGESFYVPFGSSRKDVQRAFPLVPSSEFSGFGRVYNFNRLSPGTHFLDVSACDVSGECFGPVRTVFTVAEPLSERYEFVRDVSLENAFVSIQGNKIVLEGIEVPNEPETKSRVLEWNEASQKFAIASQPILDDSAGDGGEIVLESPPFGISGDVTWTYFAEELRDIINEVRSTPTVCGSNTYPAVDPLEWDSGLGFAALKHSQDMAINDFFAHDGSDGSTFISRAAQFGSAARNENIGAGYRDPESVVDGWVGSPGHCLNLMSPHITKFGTGMVIDRSSTWGNYWTFLGGI